LKPTWWAYATTTINGIDKNASVPMRRHCISTMRFNKQKAEERKLFAEEIIKCREWVQVYEIFL